MKFRKNFIIFLMIISCVILFSCAKKEPIVETKVAVESQKEAETEIVKIYDFEKITNAKIDKVSGYVEVNIGTYGDEDVKWLVIDKNDDTTLLLSKDIIDCKNYNDVKEEVIWQKSTLRSWLNEIFVKEVFDSAYNNKFGNINAYGFGLIKGDKVSLLNVAMCEKYFGLEDSNKQNKKIVAKVTKFAKEHGEEYDNNKNTDFYNCGSFFLTDNGNSLDKAAWVGQYGHIYEDGQFVKLESGDGIRPIICLKTEVFDNGIIDLINSNLFNEVKQEREQIINIDENEEAIEDEIANNETTEETNRTYTYTNVSKYQFQSENVPCSEKNVVDLKSWKYGRTPVEWVYVSPNTQILSNNSPNKSSKFGYKAKASSGPKGCYMVAFTSCDDVVGSDYDGRLYSYEDYTKIPLDELKFSNKFDELKYGEYRVLDLLKKRYEMIDVSKGVYMAGDVYVNVIYVDELDDIILKGK